MTVVLDGFEQSSRQPWYDGPRGRLSQQGEIPREGVTLGIVLDGALPRRILSLTRDCKQHQLWAHALISSSILGKTWTQERLVTSSYLNAWLVIGVEIHAKDFCCCNEVLFWYYLIPVDWLYFPILDLSFALFFFMSISVDSCVYVICFIVTFHAHILLTRISYCLTTRCNASSIVLVRPLCLPYLLEVGEFIRIACLLR